LSYNLIIRESRRLHRAQGSLLFVETIPGVSYGELSRGLTAEWGG